MFALVDLVVLALLLGFFFGKFGFRVFAKILDPNLPKEHMNAIVKLSFNALLFRVIFWPLG